MEFKSTAQYLPSGNSKSTHFNIWFRDAVVGNGLPYFIELNRIVFLF